MREGKVDIFRPIFTDSFGGALDTTSCVDFIINENDIFIAHIPNQGPHLWVF